MQIELFKKNKKKTKKGNKTKKKEGTKDAFRVQFENRDGTAFPNPMVLVYRRIPRESFPPPFPCPRQTGG